MTKCIEYCIECDKPTGRAGIYEDSLYVEETPTADPYGPLCDECYEMVIYTGDAQSGLQG